MRAAGIKQLTGTDVPMKLMLQAFPDQNQYVQSFLPRIGKKSSVDEFQQEFHLQSCPPEFVTMMLCLFSTSMLPINCAELFEEHGAKLRRIVVDYQGQHGQWPHPLVALRKL